MQTSLSGAGAGKVLQSQTVALANLPGSGA
jgi:hypothetical protein